MSAFSGMNIPGWHFKPGSGWWVLACKKTCDLSQATMSVKKSTHADYEGPPLPSQLMTWSPMPYSLDNTRKYGDAESGTPPLRERTPDDPILLAMFKPVSTRTTDLRFKPGTVTTWWHHGMPDLPVSKSDFSETSIETGRGEKAYLLQRFIDLPPEKNEPDGRRQLLIDLQINGTRQTLGAYSFHMEVEEFKSPKSYLMWIGDIDGDGKPDLLINTSSYYWDTTMFLSSLAKPGQLVGKAGQFYFSPPDSPGC